MADVVIDASVWVGVLVPRDGFHRPSRVWLEKHVEEGGTTIAPALISRVRSHGGRAALRSEGERRRRFVAFLG